MPKFNITINNWNVVTIEMYCNGLYVSHIRYKANEDYVFISMLYTEEEHRHKGYGTLLLNKVLEKYKGRAFKLWASSFENKNEQRRLEEFYEKFGFHVSNTIYDGSTIMKKKADKS